MLGQHALWQAFQHTQPGIKHSTMQLSAMKRKWRAMESLEKMLVGINTACFQTGCSEQKQWI